MARYALFLMTEHEAQGGWDDLVLIGSREECVARAEQAAHDEWAQIVDLDAGLIVSRGEWHYTPKDRITGLTADRGQGVWDYRWEA